MHGAGLRMDALAKASEGHNQLRLGTGAPSPPHPPAAPTFASCPLHLQVAALPASLQNASATLSMHIVTAVRMRRRRPASRRHMTAVIGLTDTRPR